MTACNNIAAVVVVWTLFAVLLPRPSGAGEPSLGRSDAEALNQIFGQQHWRNAGLDVHQRAAAMDPDQRLQYLTTWVLPNAGHAGFRVVVDFLPLDSATDRDGQIVSPSLDLIAAAVQQGELPQLRDAIEAAPADRPGEQVQRLAMLTLVSIEQNDLSAAGETLEQLFELLVVDPALLTPNRAAVLLALSRASQSDQLSRQFLDPGQQLVNAHQSLIDRDAWQRHLHAIVAEMHSRVQSGSGEPASSVGPVDDAAVQWRPVNRSRAWEHGSGFPAPHWQLDLGTVRNLSSHGDDFLYFASPLMGNFSIEGDVTQFGFRETQFLTGGTWIAPHSSEKLFQPGTLRGQHGHVALDPPVSTTFSVDSMHLRTTLSDAATRTYFDGRLVHTAALPKQRDPWVAVRSSYRFDGGVDDLRIAGQPTIPEQISLSDPPGLPGWFEYYQVPAQDELVAWHQQHSGDDVTGQPVTEIIGRHDPRLPPGSDAESLLVYARPMFEDGTIEYEFWYQLGQSVVHPALGRQCFLLDPGGIRLHQLTDGVYDRTLLRPGNSIAQPEQRRGHRSLPLQPRQWNRVRLRVTGDTLDIDLNEQPVYQRRLESHAERTFGLFHFADRQEARVRRVWWTGDWSKQLPSVDDQLLAAIPRPLQQKNSLSMTQEFTYRFEGNVFKSQQFVVTEGDLIAHFRDTSAGMVIAREAESGYRNAKLTPNLVLGGDFDVVVSFDQLDLQALPRHTATAMLEVRTTSEAQDLGALQRKEDLQGNQVYQCAHLQRINGTDRYHFFNREPVLADAGQLRLSRRDDQLFYLLAEHDSDQFRPVGQINFTTADVPATGIRFGVQAHGTAGHAHVRYKTFHVRAERLEGLVPEDLDAMLASLDHRRQQLTVPLEFHFANGTFDSGDFTTWNRSAAWQATDDGISIVAVGTDDWTSAGVALRRMIAGDFDLEVALDPSQLDVPPSGQECSVMFQVELADPGQTQISTMVVRSSAGSLVAEAQSRTTDADGEYIYDQLGAADLPQYGSLRIVRRGQRAYCIAASSDRKVTKIIAQADIGTAPLNPTGIRLLVHTGGAGRTSQVLVKSLQGRAQQVINDMTPAPPRPVGTNRVPASKPTKSLWQSILDVF